MESWESRTQGTRDAATVLPFVAVFLFLPPVILVFAAPALIFGIPLIVVYIYGVWAAVILAALLLARRLERAEREAGDEPDADLNTP